jgi:hypothetical protein
MPAAIYRRRPCEPEDEFNVSQHRIITDGASGVVILLKQVQVNAAPSFKVCRNKRWLHNFC